MRELRGVVFGGRDDFDLKSRALFFDRFEVWQAERPWRETPLEVQAELEFLRDVGIIVDAPTPEKYDPVNCPDYDLMTKIASPLARLRREVGKEEAEFYVGHAVRDVLTQRLASQLGSEGSFDAVPIYEFGWWDTDNESVVKGVAVEELLKISLPYFPVPSDSSSWEDILAFKADMIDKQWHFRRFLHALVGKNQTEAEIRDDIEWSLNEYTKAMKIHHLKAGNSFVEVYVIPVIELVEDLAKLNWSKIAKGVLSVKKRNVELLEAEMKAPGREVAYIYDAKKRFGQGGR